MVSCKVTLALALAFVAVAQAAPGAPGVYAADYHAYPKYAYSYGVKDVKTGDFKDAHESRDGDVVKGSYSLVQPDGVLRTVNYIAGPHTGFQAEVINSAPAIHAVKKVVAPVAVAAPIAHHGYGHEYGHGYGGYAVAPVAKAVAPLGYGYGHSGYGHGGHYAAPVVAIKPAAISYSHGIGPVVGGHHGYQGAGALGYGHHAALGYAGHGGFDYDGGLGHHGGHHGGFAAY